MNAMLARALQILLIIVGVFFFLGMLWPVPSHWGNSAGASHHFSIMFERLLNLTFSFLCFLGAYKISRWGKKKAK